MSLRRRLALKECGFALFELVTVFVIIAILTAIGVTSYLYGRETAEEVAAKTNLRNTVPAIEAWRADNTGTAFDVDGLAGTRGYEGMTLALLRSNYSAGLGAVDVPAAGFVLTETDYCISSTVGVYTFFKHGPDGELTKVTGSTPLCS
jgi:type II secretory pathway pseudopilin PulG